MSKVGTLLFANDPAMKCRDAKGRYATAERAYADRAISENKYLRFEREKYMRAWQAAVKTACYWEREFKKLKESISHG